MIKIIQKFNLKENEGKLLKNSLNNDTNCYFK